MELTPPPLSRRYHPLIEGFRVNWQTLLLIAAINTGIALVLWIDDPRPFWHPFVTVQLNGFAIAYCVRRHGTSAGRSFGSRWHRSSAH